MANIDRIIGAGITAGALLIILLITPASAQTLAHGASCNCIIDLTTNSSSGHFNNITGLTIPKVKILKNETLMSQTEGRLSWIAIKSTQLMGILANGIFLGNFTGTGTSSTVPLNTLNVKPNESLGVEISGGTIPSPTAVKVEIVKAKVNVNGTLEEIRTAAANNTLQLYLHYNNMIKKPILGINQFLVDVKHSGYYLLLMSLGYNIKANNSSNLITTGTNITDKFLGSQQTRFPLIAIYETILRIG